MGSALKSDRTAFKQNLSVVPGNDLKREGCPLLRKNIGGGKIADIMVSCYKAVECCKRVSDRKLISRSMTITIAIALTLGAVLRVFWVSSSHPAASAAFLLLLLVTALCFQSGAARNYPTNQVVLA